MYQYECHTCHGLCDPGELENGVCFECRAKAVEREEERQFEIRKELAQMMRARYAQQPDGQMVMTYGK